MSGYAILERVTLPHDEVDAVNDGYRRPKDAQYDLKTFRKFLGDPFYKATELKRLLKKQKVVYSEIVLEDCIILAWEA